MMDAHFNRLHNKIDEHAGHLLVKLDAGFEKVEAELRHLRQADVEDKWIARLEKVQESVDAHAKELLAKVDAGLDAANKRIDELSKAKE